MKLEIGLNVISSEPKEIKRNSNVKSYINGVDITLDDHVVTIYSKDIIPNWFLLVDNDNIEVKGCYLFPIDISGIYKILPHFYNKSNNIKLTLHGKIPSKIALHRYNSETNSMEEPSINGLQGDYGLYEPGSTLTLSDENIKSVTTNNPYVIKIGNNILKKKFSLKRYKYNISLLRIGSGCLKITLKNGTTRLYGIYTKKHDEIDRLRLGSISDNDTYAMKFWKDYEMNGKYCDTIYSYFNIETIDNFLKNSLKLGMNVCVIYKQIFSADNVHNNADFIESYFDKLLEFINIINEHPHSVVVIMEPGFITNLYKIQCNPKKIYVNMNKIKYTKLQLPKPENTLASFIKTINRMFKIYSEKTEVSHCVNLSVLSSELIPITRRIKHDEGLAVIKEEAIKLAIFYKKCGVQDYRYLTFDKYKKDVGLIENEKVKREWYWNNDLWLNWLYFIKTMCEHLDMYSILWQIPSGKLNNSRDVSPYTNTYFEDHTNVIPDGEDNASIFFFGGKINNNDKYLQENEWHDYKFTVKDGSIVFKEHLKEVYDSRVRYLLFGAGSKESTTNIYMKQSGGKCTDKYFTISKFQEYYKRIF